MVTTHEPSTDEQMFILQYLASLVKSSADSDDLDGATPHAVSKKAFTKVKRPQHIKDALEYMCELGLVKILGRGGTGTLYAITPRGFEFYNDHVRDVMLVLKKFKMEG